MDTGQLLYFLKALGFTWVIEIPVIWLLVKYVLKEQCRFYRVLAIGLLATGITLPIFWFLLPPLFPDYTIYLVAGESIVVVIEAIIFRLLLLPKFSQALAVSVVANLFSTALGMWFLV